MSISQPKGPLRGLGSYTQQQQSRTDRRPAVVVKYQGQRAHIRLHDGTTYAMASEPLLAIGVPEGGSFLIVTSWLGKTPTNVIVERHHEARPSLGRRPTTPKIVVRSGRKMITRQPPAKPKMTPSGIR